MSEDQFMGNLYQRFPVTIEKGVGAHVWDIDGKEYIDCMVVTQKSIAPMLCIHGMLRHSRIKESTISAKIARIATMDTPTILSVKY